MNDDTSDPGIEEELQAAFSGAYGDLAREAAALRRQVERQSNMLANMSARERAHRKMLEDQYQLIRARERDNGTSLAPARVLTIPVHEAMGMPVPEQGAESGRQSPVSDWVDQGGATDALQRPVLEKNDTVAQAGAEVFRTLRSPSGQAWRPSPGLAAFSLPRGELRTLGFNLIGAPDSRLEHLAEEIAQSVALNRRFAPVIFTTTRAGLNSFRSRRLTYESLPVFSDTIARVTGVPDAKAFYDLRLGYLVRKWRIQGVMNLGQGYTYGT